MQISTTNVLLSLNGTRIVARDSAGVDGAEVASLTRKLAAGDEQAFRQFHALYFDRLYQFLLVIARGQEHEAQEALQETLVRVARYVRVFENEATFWTWLKAVARNAARDGGRKQRRYLTLLRNFTLHWGHSGNEQGSHDETPLRTLLEESLEELDPSDRRILAGKYLEGLTVKELASDMGLTDKAIEARLLRLRRFVRERILKKLGTP